jgi:hypothetical protein
MQWLGARTLAAQTSPFGGEGTARCRDCHAEDLRHHKCLVRRGYISETWPIELGQASIAVFDAVFSALFERVFTLEPGRVGQAGGQALPLIEVRLLGYDGCEAKWPIVGTTTISVAYEATLHGKEGSRIARWQGSGQAGPADFTTENRDAGTGLRVEGLYLSTVTRVAMRRAAADFIVNYENNPAIRTWLGK